MRAMAVSWGQAIPMAELGGSPMTGSHGGARSKKARPEDLASRLGESMA